MLPGHILTGPFAVEGAEPGDTLEVRIEAVELRQDWGYNFHRPLGGALPDDFPHLHRMNIPLDRERMIAGCHGASTCPLRPSSA